MKGLIKAIVFVVVAVGAMFLSSKAIAENAELSFDFAGLDRTCILHIPEHYTPSETYPLMFVFHGLYGNAAGIERRTRFDTIADQNNFFVAYPESIGSKWKLAGKNNDIAFMGHIIQIIENKYSIDSRHIYVSGFSHGGGMVERLACTETDKIAGAAVVAENLNAPIENACHPSRPISIVLFHGTQDPISPYNGGPNGVSGSQVFSALHTAQFWAQADGCPVNPQTANMADKLSDGTYVTDTEQSWSGCSQGVGVTFYTIQGGGHTWPGEMPPKDFGPASQELNASQIIWDTLNSSHAK